MAAGNGKTLLTHAHLLRYRRLAASHGRARDLNRILLLTPNEGLSRQHLREFEAAGIEAEIFSKEGRGRGVGFFEAGNFHPDFIVWLLAGDRQHVTFVDPKGIRNVGVDDPKIRFFETI